jgi:hypothetical protein
VSSKQGGIIQPDYTNVLDKEVNKSPHKVLYNENPSVEDLIIELKDLNYLIEQDIFLTPDERGAAFIERNRVEKQIKQLVTKK